MNGRSVQPIIVILITIYMEYHVKATSRSSTAAVSFYDTSQLHVQFTEFAIADKLIWGTICYWGATSIVIFNVCVREVELGTLQTIPTCP